MSEHLAVIAAVIYGVILTPFAVLGIAAQVRRSRARRAPPPTRAWALFDVPTSSAAARAGATTRSECDVQRHQQSHPDRQPGR